MRFNIKKEYLTKFAYDSPDYLRGFTYEDILGLDYGKKDLLDDMIYIAKGYWIDVDYEEEFEDPIIYKWFLVIKIPYINLTKKDWNRGLDYFSERFIPSDYLIIPINWSEKYGWMRTHIDALRGIDIGDNRIKEWAMLKKPNIPFINWIVRNPMEVKE